jgi:hypothetical protein
LLSRAGDGHAAISLSVAKDSPAVQLFERYGFEKVDERDGAITMRAELQDFSRRSPIVKGSGIARWDLDREAPYVRARSAACAVLLGLLLFLGSARVAVAGSGTPPNVITAPVIAGMPYKGANVTCSSGQWGGSPSTLAWQWSLDGASIVGANGETYTVLGSDVDHLVGCAVTATNAFGSTTAPSAQIKIVRIAVRLRPHIQRTQTGPTIEVSGRLATEFASESGIVEFLRQRDGRTVVVAHTKPGKRGGFKLTETVRALVPGKYPFKLRFVPHDPELYESIVLPVVVTIVKPRTYPFARSKFERRPTVFDHLTPFWRDGLPCSVGCRPAGVVPGWPLKPFSEQHPLRAGINELRGSGFHLGIDIQTVGMAHIYAIQPGRAHVIQAHGGDARVQIGNYIYWHVKLAVREGQYISAYRTTVGKVMHNVRHLHLSEVDASGRYLNPLRPAGRGLAPWEDLEPPVIGRAKVGSDGTALVSSFDPQSYVVRTGYVTPVLGPAALAYRLFDVGGNPLGRLQWALRGTAVLPNGLIGSVFAPGSRSPGYLCFAFRVICVTHWRYYIAGGLAPRLPAFGRRYRMTVYAWDWAGNTTARDQWVWR